MNPELALYWLVWFWIYVLGLMLASLAAWLVLFCLLWLLRLFCGPLVFAWQKISRWRWERMLRRNGSGWYLE